jgi:hypothetical protein
MQDPELSTTGVAGADTGYGVSSISSPPLRLLSQASATMKRLDGVVHQLLPNILSRQRPPFLKKIVAPCKILN